MGFTPQQVDGMELFQFLACVDGFSEANGGKKSGPAAPEMADHELRALGVEGF